MALWTNIFFNSSIYQDLKRDAIMDSNLLLSGTVTTKEMFLE